MSTLGTFDGFNTMRLGIYAAQQGLRVTGNNISNINTVGYTRQRADQVSFKTGGSDRYASMTDKKVGNGVLISGINQIRDPFLDIRYRNASNDTYHMDTWLAGMNDIAAILDEVGKGENKGDGLLYAQLQDLAKKLRAYSANPTVENDRLVRNSASSLTALFHSAADRLDRLYKDTEVDFGNSVTAVNEILVNIRDLDKSIREAEIHGDMALELRDERNLQIDKLSQYLDIKVEYSYEDVGSGIQVEKLTIKLNNANPDESVTSDEAILVDGLYCTQLSVPKEKPLANTYGDTYAYLQGYSYLKKIAADDFDALDSYLQANGLLEDDIKMNGLTIEEDGKTYYVFGTNSVEEATKVANDNYTIQLAELTNSKGDLWEKTTTTWMSVEGTREDDYAEFAYRIRVFDKLGVGSTFGIDYPTGAKQYTIVEGAAQNDTEISFADICTDDGTAVDPAKFASVLADLFNKNGKFPGFTAHPERNEKGSYIILKADDVGTKTPPDFGDDPEDNPLFDVGKVDIRNPGYTTVAPAEGSKTTDKYGNTTTVRYRQIGDQWYKVTVKTEYTREIALDDNDTHGILQAQRELLTEEGEFASEYDVAIDENALTKRGIPYYQKSLDLLAQKLAEAYNELNTGFKVDQNGHYLDKDNNVIPELAYLKQGDELTAQQKQNLIDAGYYLKDKDGNAVDKHGYPVSDDQRVPDLNTWLEDMGAVPMGGVLFSNGNNGNDTAGINAHNIDISYGWSNGKWGLVPKFEEVIFTDGDEGLSQTTKNTNADHMLAMIDKVLTYNPQDLYGSDAIGPELFAGSFNDMFSHMMAVEAEDARTTTVKLNSSAIILEDLDYRREGISGVDLNDEAMNMVQYQKAMSAAMRLMTAIDEALERLINNTGVAGR